MIRHSSMFFLAFAWIFAGCQSELGTLKVNWKIHTLANGLRLVVVEDHSIPLISYQTWVGVGSVNEVAGKTGLAHFFEHLMFKGTSLNPGRTFFEKLEIKGAEVNAMTSRDTTTFYENFSPELLDTVIELESDRFQNLLIDEARMQTEKAVVLEERRLRVDSQPVARIQEALWGMLFRVHPYSHPVSGWPQDVVQLSTQDLNDFFETYYQPKNVVIVVVGDVNTASLIQKIQNAYGNWKPKRELKKPEITIEPEQIGERRWNVTDGVSSEQLMMGYPISAAKDDDSFALDLLSGILFSGLSSRAHQQLVEKDQIALSVTGSSYTPQYSGIFSIHIVMKPGIPSSKAEFVMENLINQFKKELVTQSDLDRVRKQFLVGILDGVRTPFGLGQWIGTVTILFNEPNRFVSDYKKYMKVKPEDIQRIALKYFEPNKRNVVVLMPKTKAKSTR